MKKTPLKLLGNMIGIGVATVGAYVTYLTIKEKKYGDVEKLDVKNNPKDNVKLGEEIIIVTNNIGYGGMDKDIHFFMDGGSMSRAISKERVQYNTNGVVSLLKERNPDVIMMQEVDLNSTRSYKVNQRDIIRNEFREYGYTYGINYDVPWIAYPIIEPHGKVISGQMTLCNKYISSSERVALPVDETWPQRLVGLDRAMIVTRMPVENGKELVVINLHLSAYDKGGKIRMLQIKMVSDFLEREYHKGNYIIIGGDWNQVLPNSDPSIFMAEEKWPNWLVEMPETFEPKGFQWAFHGSVPTCRSVRKEYIKGYNFLVVIDGFMVSSNIEVLDIQTIDTGFEYSDHNPVELKITLLKG